ncbi:lipopolysaccharide-induced tumor necrosis factor-alpha factor homolog [Ostrinia nubilalis]|uniref:lipopolysaccharide-induced tumor necrosis factor-alpha factor homolog n=1 Tax=Ostrinia furnacalis TaxID=93504 RepID=UPI00103E3105|nr:lipopolysaccharide-induced tumor necrosis factor-alpha factor homolog [Ostrinia furnacalis]
MGDVEMNPTKVTIVTNAPAPGAISVGPVGPDEMAVTCPSCLATVTTRVERKASTKTHMIALAICVCFGCLCAWIPYCKNSCRNADHYCPNCDSYLGTYQN